MTYWKSSEHRWESTEAHWNSCIDGNEQHHWTTMGSTKKNMKTSDVFVSLDINKYWWNISGID